MAVRHIAPRLVGIGLLFLCLAGLHRPASASNLASTLLAGDDLPQGWTMQAGDPTAAFDYAWCPSVRAGLPAPLARSAAVYVGGAPGPVLYYEVLEFPAGGAERALALAREGAGCAWDESGADTSPMTFTLDNAIAAPHGDESLARTLTGTWEAMALEAAIVLVRRGDLLAVLTHVQFDDEIADSRLTARLAERADARLAALTGAPSR